MDAMQKLTMQQLVDKIEFCNFECEAGALTMSDDWKELLRGISEFSEKDQEIIMQAINNPPEPNEHLKSAFEANKDLVHGKMCMWKEDDGAWQTDCGNAFCLENGTPADNNMLYCCFCGKTILEEGLKEEPKT